MKTVYWAPFPLADNPVMKISELSYAEPENVLKSIQPVEYFGADASKCPSIINECKNTFKIKSPIDLSITFNDDFSRFRSKYEQDNEFISHLIGPFGLDRVIQLAAPTYLFYCEEPLLMTQLPPYYEENTFVDNCLGLSATFDIGKWFRVVKPSFKLRQKSHTIEFEKDTPLMYLKFNTEEKIKLVRFNSSVFNKEHKDIIDNMFSFKFHKKHPLLTNSLSESYNAFKNARYNKRVTKIIKENLLE
jgi:hypothetical protein